MESLSILQKILQDNGQSPIQPSKILQDPTQSYQVIQDPRQNPTESLSIPDKML